MFDFVVFVHSIAGSTNRWTEIIVIHRDEADIVINTIAETICSRQPFTSNAFSSRASASFVSSRPVRISVPIRAAVP
jgi:hypothetical protein